MIRFCDLDLIFKVTQPFETRILIGKKKKLVVGGGGGSNKHC